MEERFARDARKTGSMITTTGNLNEERSARDARKTGSTTTTTGNQSGQIRLHSDERKLGRCGAGTMSVTSCDWSLIIPLEAIFVPSLLTMNLSEERSARDARKTSSMTTTTGNQSGHIELHSAGTMALFCSHSCILLPLCT